MANWPSQGHSHRYSALRDCNGAALQHPASRVVCADHGHQHYGPEVEVPTSYQFRG